MTSDVVQNYHNYERNCKVYKKKKNRNKISVLKFLLLMFCISADISVDVGVLNYFILKELTQEYLKENLLNKNVLMF